jgi:bacterial/archaeal transporter family-2 protein
MQPFAVPLLLFVGGLLALQAAANVQLSKAMGSPFGASTVQLGIGAALLLVVAAFAGSLGALGLLDKVAPWQLAGGLGSALYITAGILLFPRLGALVAVGLFIAGQMLASLLLDGFGWLGVEHRALDVTALTGALAAGAGVWLIVRAQAGARAFEAAAHERRWLVLGLAAGAVLPIQGAINAQLNARLDAATAVAAVSFLVATAAMALALAGVLAAGAPRPRVTSLRGVPWWGWLGGLCGATYVTTVFSLIPDIGAEPVVVLTVAGQQLASVAVDRYGLLGLPRRAIPGRRLAGVAVLLCGVALITVV